MHRNESCVQLSAPTEDGRLKVFVRIPTEYFQNKEGERFVELVLSRDDLEAFNRDLGIDI